MQYCCYKDLFRIHVTISLLQRYLHITVPFLYIYSSGGILVAVFLLVLRCLSYGNGSAAKMMFLFQYCCYNHAGSLITAQDGSGGQMYLYHPRRNDTEHQARDIQPKRWCCKDSDNCDKFYALRPMSNCSGYVTPTLGTNFFRF